MGQLSRQVHRRKSGDSLGLRSAHIDDAQALLDHGKAIVDEGEIFVTSPDEYIFTLEQEQDWIRQYVDDLLMYRFVKGMTG